MAEDAGYIYAGIVFDTTQLEQGVVKAQASVDAVEKKIKKQNENISNLTQKNINGFFKAWEKGFASSGQRLGRLLSSMFNPLTLGIGALTVAIGKATSAISEAIKRQRDYNKALKDGKDIAASATKEVTNYGDKVKTAGDRQKVFVSAVQKAQEAQRNYNLAMKEASRIDDGEKRKEAELNAAKQLNTEVFTNLERLKESRENGEKELEAAQKRLELAQKYGGFLGYINTNAKSALDTMEIQVKSLEKQNAEYDEQIKTWQDLDAEQQSSIKNSETLTRTKEEQKKLDDERKKVESAINDANEKAAMELKHAQEDYNAGHITIEQRDEKILSVVKQQRETMQDIRDTAAEYPDLLKEAADKVVELDGALGKLNQKGKSWFNNLLDWTKENENAITASKDIFVAMVDLQTATMNRALEDQLAVVEETLAAQQEMLDAQYEITMSKLEEERQAALEAAGFVAATTEENLSAAMEAAIASGDEGVIYREKRRQEELKINQKYDKLEKQAELDKEKAEKELQEQAAREKADLEYQMAMNTWEQQLIQAHLDLATGIIKSWAQGGGLIGGILAALTAAAGAIQIQTIQQSKPKQPAFAAGGVIGLPQTYSYANGGIVDSPTPRGVDAVQATLANREMILNDSQQANLFNAINSGAVNGGISLTLNTILDSEIIATRTIELVNNGITQTIDNRMVV
ncbi:phage tail tape measure protein lambda [Candidatus Termititenax persephonae]|uniref:Phage tail tape measure protein lambda n=1 Tax=Candidatus Termititenax persephonae TaxID=2218525 RepID=A0A388TG65_9BACT|nr:phage tail tape measure protein lambda [Candidatus Termititenax persephonae]